MRRWLPAALLTLLLAGCGSTSKSGTVVHLAYVAGARVHVLGSRAQPLAGSDPVWSQDGRWLALLTPRGALEIEGGDGTSPQPVQGLSGPVAPGDFAWSPTADMLAVAPEQGGLWLVSGGARQLAAAGTRVWSLAWSPGGHSVAYAVTQPYTDVVKRSDALYTVPITGGAPKRQYVANEAGIELATWNLLWLDPLHSSSIAADGLGLVQLPSGRVLTTTLVRRDWLSFSGKRVLLVTGQGREPMTDKALAICDLASVSCHTLPQPAGSVSLDPAWSPDGKRMAFVRAGVYTGPVTSSAVAAAWTATRTLWLAAGDGSGAHEVTAAGRGVSGPQWSPDGRQVYYLRDGALWTYDVETGKVSQLASGGVSSFALAR